MIKSNKTIKKSTDKNRKFNPKCQTLFNDFVAFTALPLGFRQKEYGYETEKEWREAHRGKKSISPNTTHLWKQKEEFWDAVQALWKQWSRDKTPTVISALFKTAAKEGKAPEVKLWMQVVEGWQEKTENTSSLAREDIKKLQDGLREIISGEKSKKK
jgi:hypothetical protein